MLANLCVDVVPKCIDIDVCNHSLWLSHLYVGNHATLNMPSGNQTWQWTIHYEWRFIARKITYKWSILQQAMFDYWRV